MYQIRLKTTNYEKIISIFALCFLVSVQAYGLSNVCPGEPTVIYWSSSNTSGVCNPDTITPGGGSIPSCNFTVIPNSSNSSTIYPASSCTVTLICDGLTASDDVYVDPNQSRCCGNWDLVSQPYWNGSSCTGMPDLTVDAATPSSAVPGENTTLSAVIRNIGSASTNSSFNYFFQVAPLPNGGGAITELLNSNMGTLAPGANNTGTKVYTFPGGPGTYSIRACADKANSGDDGVIPEANENNNCGSPWTTVTVACNSPDSWDSIGGECVNPTVIIGTITGSYYPPGTLDLECSSDTLTYSILREDGSTFASGVYSTPVHLTNIPAGNNYVLKCIHGTVENQVVRSFNPTPDPTVINVKVTPRSIQRDDKVTITWSTDFPTPSCSLYAKVVCPNNACSVAQLAASSSLNAILNSQNTDVNDPASSRLIQTAIQEVAPGHKDTDVPLIVADFKALGRKTLQIKYTTDLIYDCGGGNKVTNRILVTKSEEQ